MSQPIRDVLPHLTTRRQEPLYEIESHILSAHASIETWFRTQWRLTPAPFYASVDLRNAGFKLAPVDTNLFPAGFNNLSKASIPLCIQAMQAAIEQLEPTAVRILLIPENHTRNLFYLENIASLRDIIDQAGYEVRIGSMIEGLTGPKDIQLPSGRAVCLEPLIRQDNRTGVGDFFPCCILLNNDLAGGRPAILEDLDQNIIPPLNLGWSNRLKSSHFARYNEVADEFSGRIDIDSWLINPMFRNCGEINFMNREGEDCLSRHVDTLLTSIQAKYDQYGVSSRPFIIIKADAGTYGMAVMTVHSADEVKDLNRKQRTRMSTTKEGQQVSQVILQEGVYTNEAWGSRNAVAEPVIYLIDHFVVGGAYRIHDTRGANENLNMPGMRFEPLPFLRSCNTPDNRLAPDAEPNRFYAYGVTARLALLAAAREIAEHRDNQEPY